MWQQINSNVKILNLSGCEEKKGEEAKQFKTFEPLKLTPSSWIENPGFFKQPFGASSVR